MHDKIFQSIIGVTAFAALLFAVVVGIETSEPAINQSAQVYKAQQTTKNTEQELRVPAAYQETTQLIGRLFTLLEGQTFTSNSSGSYVAVLKRFLNEMSISKEPLDTRVGTYDTKTQEAVQNLNAYFGIKGSDFTPETLEKIQQGFLIKTQEGSIFYDKTNEVFIRNDDPNTSGSGANPLGLYATVEECVEEEGCGDMPFDEQIACVDYCIGGGGGGTGPAGGENPGTNPSGQCQPTISQLNADCAVTDRAEIIYPCNPVGGICLNLCSYTCPVSDDSDDDNDDEVIDDVIYFNDAGTAYHDPFGNPFVYSTGNGGIEIYDPYHGYGGSSSNSSSTITNIFTPLQNPENTVMLPPPYFFKTLFLSQPLPPSRSQYVVNDLHLWSGGFALPSFMRGGWTDRAAQWAIKKTDTNVGQSVVNSAVNVLKWVFKGAPPARTAFVNGWWQYFNFLEYDPSDLSTYPPFAPIAESVDRFPFSPINNTWIEEVELIFNDCRNFPPCWESLSNSSSNPALFGPNGITIQSIWDSVTEREINENRDELGEQDYIQPILSLLEDNPDEMFNYFYSKDFEFEMAIPSNMNRIYIDNPITETPELIVVNGHLYIDLMDVAPQNGEEGLLSREAVAIIQRNSNRLSSLAATMLDELGFYFDSIGVAQIRGDQVDEYVLTATDLFEEVEEMRSASVMIAERTGDFDVLMTMSPDIVTKKDLQEMEIEESPLFSTPLNIMATFYMEFLGNVYNFNLQETFKQLRDVRISSSNITNPDVPYYVRYQQAPVDESANEETYSNEIIPGWQNNYIHLPTESYLIAQKNVGRAVIHTLLDDVASGYFSEEYELYLEELLTEMYPPTDPDKMLTSNPIIEVIPEIPIITEFRGPRGVEREVYFYEVYDFLR